MNAFHDYKFKWWQVAILKFTMFSLGITVGAYWAEIFTDWLLVLFFTALALSVYLAYISFKQK